MEKIPFIIKLRLAVNSLDTSSNRILQDEVGLEFLNDAYLQLVKAKCKNSMRGDDFYGKDILVDEELSHLVKNYPAEVEFDGNQFLVKVPDNMLKLTNVLLVADKCGDNIRTSIKPNFFASGNETIVENDPFNFGTVEYPNIYFNGEFIFTGVKSQSLKVFADGQIDEVILKYLSLPEVIDINTTEIQGLTFAQDIVDAAAMKVLAAWGDPKVQLKDNVDKTIKFN